mgnify:CR=1 FL=1
MITTPSGLQYEDELIGSGPEARAGQDVRVHYTGWLYENGVQGRKFDSSKDRNDPFRFDLGVVRGLAYYTGTVFEIFERNRTSVDVVATSEADRLRLVEGCVPQVELEDPAGGRPRRRLGRGGTLRRRLGDCSRPRASAPAHPRAGQGGGARCSRARPARLLALAGALGVCGCQRGQHAHLRLRPDRGKRV